MGSPLREEGPKLSRFPRLAIRPTQIAGNADDDAVIFQDASSSRSYTYGQVKQVATDFGKGLKGLWDWQRGDVLGVYSPNCIDTPAVTWAVHFAGGIVSPANPGYTVEELAFQLKDSGAKALITQVPQLKIALEAAKIAGIPDDRVILMGDQRAEAGRFKHFSSIRNTSGTQRYRRAKVDPDKDLAFLVYSSGTTVSTVSRLTSHKTRLIRISCCLCRASQKA